LAGFWFVLAIKIVIKNKLKFVALTNYNSQGKIHSVNISFKPVFAQQVRGRNYAFCSAKCKTMLPPLLSSTPLLVSGRFALFD
jgi:hypothetical protein